MNKEVILKKSRNENVDEGIVNVENDGCRLGYMAFIGVFALIMIVNFIYMKPSYAPLAMFLAFLATEAYPKYKFIKKKGYLISIIAGSFASIFCLISFVMDTIG